MKLLGTMAINELGHLEIGNCDTVNLAYKYGTPLYVVDTKWIKSQCYTFKNAFKGENAETEVIYASKAFLNIAMCQLINEQGLSLDVVSGGELFTAMKADFPATKIYFHGNNKTVEELIMALNYGVKQIVVDHEMEIEMLQYLCSEMNKHVDVLLRINPGIEAHTHEYIQTANLDSKFGISTEEAEICQIVSSIRESYYLHLKGFHYHIGSQITEVSSFIKAADVMTDFVYKIKTFCGYETQVLNMGGGFGVYYSEGDEAPDLQKLLPEMVAAVETMCADKNIKLPKLLIEPGRAIVANAGTTLYKIGATKLTASGKEYVFVDGGMADNPRTALYDAVYEAAIANRMNDEEDTPYTVAGKCCESGDILIRKIQLPKAKRNDFLAVASTGAYNYSMASHYNRLRKPAVVMVENGNSKVVVRRETYEDLIRNDCVLREGL